MANWTKSRPNVWETRSPDLETLLASTILAVCILLGAHNFLRIPSPWPTLLGLGGFMVILTISICAIRTVTLDTKRCILRSRWLLGMTEVLKFRAV